MPGIDLTFLGENEFSSRIGDISDLKLLGPILWILCQKWGLPTLWRLSGRVYIKESKWYLDGSILRYLYNDYIFWILGETARVQTSPGIYTNHFLPPYADWCSHTESRLISSNFRDRNIWRRDEGKISFGNLSDSITWGNW